MNSSVHRFKKLINDFVSDYSAGGHNQDCKSETFMTLIYIYIYWLLLIDSLWNHFIVLIYHRAIEDCFTPKPKSTQATSSSAT